MKKRLFLPLAALCGFSCTGTTLALEEEPHARKRHRREAGTINRGSTVVRRVKATKNAASETFPDLFLDYEEKNLPAYDEPLITAPMPTPSKGKGSPSTSRSKGKGKGVAPTIYPSTNIPSRSPTRHAKVPTHYTKRPSAHHKSASMKKSKKSKSMSKIHKPTPRPTRSPSASKGKGKGKGGTPSPAMSPIAPSPPVRPPTTAGDCTSPVMAPILNAVPEIMAQTPERCCNFGGATAAIVTHAFSDDSTPSNFEPFWDQMYQVLARTTGDANVCFFMTGIDSSVNTARDLSDILINVLDTVRNTPTSTIPTIMATDPTNSTALIQTIRSISNNAQEASIGVFNAGYETIILESIVSGQQALPFVGYADDRQYGVQAGIATLELLGEGATVVPLCFNARLGVLDFVGQRCEAYYATVSATPVVPEQGVNCSAETTAFELFQQVVRSNATAIWGHVDCCEAMGGAAILAQSVLNITVVAGCQDIAEPVAGIDFATLQPIDLQAYHTASWVSFPVQQALAGNQGNDEQYFPSLSSFINTAIFNIFF